MQDRTSRPRGILSLRPAASRFLHQSSTVKSSCNSRTRGRAHTGSHTTRQWLPSRINHRLPTGTKPAQSSSRVEHLATTSQTKQRVDSLSSSRLTSDNITIRRIINIILSCSNTWGRTRSCTLKNFSKTLLLSSEPSLRSALRSKAQRKT